MEAVFVGISHKLA